MNLTTCLVLLSGMPNWQLAVDSIHEENPASDCIKAIQTASLRAKDVVRKLLSVARKTPSKRKPIQIDNIVKESLGLLRKTIPATIDIQEHLFCTTETILADPTEMNQVLINLCTNLAHAMGRRTGMITVRLETVTLDLPSSMLYEGLKPGNFARLTVADTGEGIDPDIMERIFDPYYTTKDVDMGLGMGLALVNGIIKEYDGAIRVESEVGRGTTVEMLFPLIRTQADTGTEKSETLSSGTERILLVDDEEPLLTVLMQMIEHCGYTVTGYTSGSEALELFQMKSERFDLVITDMSMPNIPGDQLARKMLQIRGDIPISLSTGHNVNIDEQTALDAGIKAFIMKPFSLKEIAKIIRGVLDDARK